MKKLFFLSLCLILSLLTFSNKVDSLEKALPTINHDSLKIRTLVKLCEMLHATDPKKSLTFGKQALQLAEKSGKYNELVNTYYRLAISSAQNGDYPNATQYFFKTKELAEQKKDTNFILNVLSSLTVMHGIRGEHEKAMNYLNEKLRIDEIQGNKPFALDYDMLGNLHETAGNFEDAVESYKKGIKIASATKDSNSLASLYCNLGITLSSNGQLDSAKKYSLLALEIDEKFNRLHGMATVYMQLGYIEHQLGNYKIAQNYYSKSLEVGEQISSLELLEELYLLISDNYKLLQNTDDALTFFKKHIELRDSLNNDEIRVRMNNIESEHKIKLKDVEIAKQQAEIKAQLASSEKKNLLIIGVFIGLGIVIIFTILLFNRFRIIKLQKNTIEQQKHLVEEKNKEITDSIQYAKRIQNAILPPNKLVSSSFNDSFVFYKPKDIVAGDFYWLEKIEDKILFAAADCTGHGVPGAMVSVVCNNGLNRSVREHKLTDPGKILNKTRDIVIQEFEKSEDEVKDGMDIALCCLNKNQLTYAGAHNPLWIIRNGANEIEEIKANKQPIGKFDNPLPYTTHSINLNSGDSIYIFSDGYIDQFGGDKGKKLKASNFKKLLLSIADLEMSKQKVKIEQHFYNWKGDNEQLDDICVIGVKI